MSEAAASGPIKMANGSYPISDQKSANSAWKLRRHSKDYSEAQVVAHIRTACNTLGLTFPGTSEKSAEYQRSLGLQRSGGFVSDLREKYGRSDPEAAAIKPKTDPGYAAETEVINKNKKHPNARKKHPFTPGQHTTPNGAQRCLQCGNTSPVGGTCPAPADIDGNETVSDKLGPQIVPVQSALDDADAGKVAAGIDAGVDQALVLLRSTPDLQPYAAQARDVLQGIEPACDELLEYFGVDDPDDDDSDASDAEQAASHPKKHKHKYVHPSRVGLRPGMAGWFGHGLCAACGQSKDDPDHDGDVDAPGGGDTDGDTQTAAFTPFIGGFTLQTNTTNWPTTTTTGYVLPTQVAYTEPRLAKPALPYLNKPDSNSFVTELNGKTLITTQAAVSKELADAMTPHQHMLWTTGRLVGADQPNRNGAYWSSSDLQSGKATVPYGPLNWLHEERHVIGTLAAAEYVPVDPGNELADGSGTAQNHIAVAAPIWKWLYPDEADVLEMASDAGKFWYSMECISRSVACIGENGCGAEVGYFDYMQGINGTCAHMVQHSATRQFVDPIFLGAAVIVPPVRPGWADADASITRQAASLAEKAFDDAGQPDMSASEWEQLMAQVVSFATC